MVAGRASLQDREEFQAGQPAALKALGLAPDHKMVCKRDNREFVQRAE